MWYSTLFAVVGTWNLNRHDTHMLWQFDIMKYNNTMHVFKDFLKGIGVDAKRGILYWAVYRRIKQMDLSGANKKVVLEVGKLNIMWLYITFMFHLFYDLLQLHIYIGFG